MRAVALLLMLGSCAGPDPATEAEQRYEFLANSGASAAELCVEAGKVAERYADKKDETAYLQWRIRTRRACQAAQLGTSID